MTTGTLTPERKVTVTWDAPEKLLVESYFSKWRLGSQIRPSASSNVMLMSSGVWVLKPVNHEFSSIRETNTGQSGIVRGSACQLASGFAELPLFRKPTELPGLSPGADVAGTGDYFIVKSVPAGTDWNASIGLGSVPQPTLPTANFAVRRILRSFDAHEPNTGYLLRWIVPGTKASNADNLFNFYFGAPVVGVGPHTGYGQYCLSVSGNGGCLLFERIDGAWSQAASWNFAPPQASVQQLGTLLILPHYPNYIEFRNFVDVFQTNSFVDLLVSAAVISIRHEASTGAKTYCHEITNRGDAGILNSSSGTLRPITGSGPVYLDVREDLRLPFQINRLIYPASGTFTDRPFTIPGEVGPTRALRIDAVGYNGVVDGVPLTATSAVPANAVTGSALPTDNTDSASFGNGRTVTYTGWQAPGGVNAIQVTATLGNLQAGTRYQTPSFMGYAAQRDGVVATIDNGAKASLDPREFDATGPGFSPEEETGRLVVEDLQGTYSFVNNRGRMPVRVETTYSDSDPKTAIIFEGYLGRCDATLRGKRGVEYPGTAWKELSCDLIGKGARMRYAYFHNYESFYDDSNASALPSLLRIPGQPWRIVDIIRHCCHLAGFDDTQLDIFEDPTRLFPQLRGNNKNLYTPNLGSSILDYILTLARDYLNAFFVWDANAGASGMWRLLRPPTGTETPLWNFVTSPAPQKRLQHLAASYAANTSPILSNEEFKSYVVPPEGNMLSVYGGFYKTPDGSGYHQVRASIANRASWDSPGFVHSDATNLDYLGMIVPVVYTDLLLQSQTAANWMARRIFNLACRGRKFYTFGAELALVAPADPVYTTHTHRPLRLGDTVTIDGTRCIVHSCSPYMTKGFQQKARYEVELYRPEITWGVRP